MNAAVLCWSLPNLGLLLPNRDWAQHQLAAMLCCCYHGTSAPCALAFFCPVLCLLRAALPQHSEAAVVAVAMPPQPAGAQSPRAGISNAPVFGILQPGTRARPTVHTCRKAWACHHFSPLLFVCCIHLGSSEQAVYLLPGRVCAWFPVCASSQA